MSPPSSSLSYADIDELSDRLIATRCPLRIFGYGSIIWLPNFAFAGRTVGWISGHKRRFYQGSASHRGTVECPGRVATLVPSSRADAVTWGVAFEIRGAEAIRAALAHLTEREMKLGGYRFHRVSFQPSSAAALVRDCELQEQCEAYVYIAEPENPLYLGKATLEQQARQVASAIGPAGSNVDYLRGIALFMLHEVPDGQARDPHLFELLRRTDGLLAAESLFRSSSSSSLSLSEEKTEVTEQSLGTERRKATTSLARHAATADAACVAAF